MTTDDKAAAQADDDALKGQSEDDGGQSELDKALAELAGDAPKDKATDDQAKQPAKTGAKDDVGAIRDEIAQWRKERAQEREAKAVERAQSGVKSVVDDLLKNETISAAYDAEEVEALLQLRAGTDKTGRIIKAFVNRDENPEAWAIVQKSLEKGILSKAEAKTGKRPSQSAAAATRGISTSAPSREAGDVPPQDKLSRMSDGEFNKLVNDLSQGA